MIELFVYSVALFGVAYILGHSRISLPFRQMLSDRSELCLKCNHCGWVPRRLWDETTEGDAQPQVIFHCPQGHTKELTADPAQTAVRGGIRILMWPVTLLECPACLGTWGGFVVGVLGYGSAVAPTLSHPVALALFSAGSNALLGFWCGLMQREARTGEQP